MTRLLALLLMLVGLSAAQAQGQGRFDEMQITKSATMPQTGVTIWLPPGYDAGKQRYPVIYMHDAQNLFFPERSNFNKVWAADKSALRLIAAKKLSPFIIVGINQPGEARYAQYFPQALREAASSELRAKIDSMTKQPLYGDAYLRWLTGTLKPMINQPGEARYAQYFPQALREAASSELRAKIDSMTKQPLYGDAYLRWLTGTLKPMIDLAYRTKKGRDHTAIAGSSMGGLISCYAFTRYPKVFGRAACVSTHWPLANPEASAAHKDEIVDLWADEFKRGLGKPNGRRLWMDHGDKTLDAYYPPYQADIGRAVAALGWTEGRDFTARAYPGAEHEENAWAARMDDIFGWMLTGW